jgi:competence protein ComEA
MIDDPDLPRRPRRRRGEPDPITLSPAPPGAGVPGSPGVPPAAPPPIDEWDLGGSEVGWAAVAPPPCGADAYDDSEVDPEERGSDDVGAASSIGRRTPGRLRDPRPLITRVLRPWFEPRPGELRGAIVLLTIGLAVSVALWFDASRRPEPSGPPSVPLATPAGVGPGVASGPAPSGGRADGSDGWGIGAEQARGPVVHVSGAVMRPGVVTLPERARVTDAIDAAGGAMPDALLDRLNLARLVEDAERVHVPRVGEDAPPPDEPASRGLLADGRIDLNAASQAELETLPGVGPARAKAIIAEREARPFRVAGDLRRVPGIGEATFQRLAPLVAVR